MISFLIQYVKERLIQTFYTTSREEGNLSYFPVLTHSHGLSLRVPTIAWRRRPVGVIVVVCPLIRAGGGALHVEGAGVVAAVVDDVGDIIEVIAAQSAAMNFFKGLFGYVHRSRIEAGVQLNAGV